MLRRLKKRIFANKANKYEMKYRLLYSKSVNYDTQKRVKALKKAEIYFDKYVEYTFIALGYVDNAKSRNEGYEAIENIRKLHNIEKYLNK